MAGPLYDIGTDAGVWTIKIVVWGSPWWEMVLAGAAAAAPAIAAGAVLGVAVMQQGDAVPASQSSRAPNVRQNQQFGRAVQAIQQRCGKYLNKDQIQQLHRAISKWRYSLDEIVEMGVGMFCPGQ
jgi:hypothetical protein